MHPCVTARCFRGMVYPSSSGEQRFSAMLRGRFSGVGLTEGTRPLAPGNCPPTAELCGGGRKLMPLHTGPNGGATSSLTHAPCVPAVISLYCVGSGSGALLRSPPWIDSTLRARAPGEWEYYTCQTPRNLRIILSTSEGHQSLAMM